MLGDGVVVCSKAINSLGLHQRTTKCTRAIFTKWQQALAGTCREIQGGRRWQRLTTTAWSWSSNKPIPKKCVWFGDNQCPFMPLELKVPYYQIASSHPNPPRPRGGRWWQRQVLALIGINERTVRMKSAKWTEWRTVGTTGLEEMNIRLSTTRKASRLRARFEGSTRLLNLPLVYSIDAKWCETRWKTIPAENRCERCHLNRLPW